VFPARSQPDARGQPLGGVSRRWRRSALVAAVAAALLPWIEIAAAPAGISSRDIAGEPPHYGASEVAEVPNEAAIVRRLWSPGLDNGDNPQGLAAFGGAIWIATYRSDSVDQHRGPCRVYRLDPQTGYVAGKFAVPMPCGHAGGLATAGDGTLYVADTHTLFATNLDGEAGNLRSWPLGPGLVGALAASAKGTIWIGTYREDGQGRLYRFDAAMLTALPNGAPLNAAQSSAQLAIPSYAQGAAFDRDGGLWVSRSDTHWGELGRLDPASGAVTSRYAIAPGTEGIAYDGMRLWAVSEAGARHSYDHFWAPLVLPFYPLVYALDPARLR